MKQLVRKPLLLAFLLSLPLWIALDNYLVALVVGLLVAFFASMAYSLHVLKKTRDSETKGDTKETPR